MSPWDGNEIRASAAQGNRRGAGWRAGPRSRSGAGSGVPVRATGPALTLDRILISARRVFTEMGYDAATFELIAERTGVTRPVINYHFGSKANLFREVVHSTNSAVVESAIVKAVTASTLLGQVSSLIESLTQAHTQDRSAARFLVSSLVDSRRHPDLRDGEYDAVSAIREFLAWAVDGAIERGELAEPIGRSAVVEMLLAVVWGVGFYGGFVGGGEALADVTAQIRRLMPGELREVPS